MRKIVNVLSMLCCVIFLSPACDTIKNLPTNTTGGLFSLNGTWQLTSTTDGQALKGTTINVYPVIGNGTIKTLQNNTYCLKEGDQVWRSVKNNDAGGFTMQTMVSACNGATVTRDATITIVNNDEVAVTSRTAGGAEMIQQWKRVTTK